MLINSLAWVCWRGRQELSGVEHNLYICYCYILSNSATIAKPRNYHIAAAQPVLKRRIRLTGMMVLASNCGDINVDLINCSIRSELGFDI